MPISVYPNGAGGTTGAQASLLRNLYTTGAIWYVGPGGEDGTTPHGRDRSRPLATLGQALTNAAAGDIIIFLANHSETLASAVSVNKAGLLLASEGVGSNRAMFTCAAEVDLFTVNAPGVRLCNLWFAASIANSTARVRISGSNAVVDGCYFECGALDSNYALKVSDNGVSDGFRLANTMFVSIAQSVDTAPEGAIQFESVLGGGVTDVEFNEVTVDGGLSGWANPYAITGDGAVDRLTATNVYLLNNSDVILASATGFFWPGTVTGGSRVWWTGGGV